MGIKLYSLINSMLDEQEVQVKDLNTGEIYARGNMLQLSYALEDDISLRESEIGIMYAEESELGAVICFYVLKG